MKPCQERPAAVGAEFCVEKPGRMAPAHQIPAVANGRDPMEVPGM